jgi:hypothetical protein
MDLDQPRKFINSKKNIDENTYEENVHQRNLREETDYTGENINQNKYGYTEYKKYFNYIDFLKSINFIFI